MDKLVVYGDVYTRFMTQCFCRWPRVIYLLVHWQFIQCPLLVRMSSSWSLRRRHDEESFRRNSVLWTAGSYAFDDWLRPRLLVGHFSIDTDFVHPQLACDKSALWFISIGKSSLVDIKFFCFVCFYFYLFSLVEAP